MVKERDEGGRSTELHKSPRHLLPLKNVLTVLRDQYKGIKVSNCTSILTEEKQE